MLSIYFLWHEIFSTIYSVLTYSVTMSLYLDVTTSVKQLSYLWYAWVKVYPQEHKNFLPGAFIWKAKTYNCFRGRLRKKSRLSIYTYFSHKKASKQWLWVRFSIMKTKSWSLITIDQKSSLSHCFIIWFAKKLYD